MIFLLIIQNNPVHRLDKTGRRFSVDDIFTGPLDEIVALMGLGIISMLCIAIEPKFMISKSLKDLLKKGDALYSVLLSIK